jgi:hypothetical protein
MQIVQESEIVQNESDQKIYDLLPAPALIVDKSYSLQADIFMGWQLKVIYI